MGRSRGAVGGFCKDAATMYTNTRGYQKMIIIIENDQTKLACGVGSRENDDGESGQR